MFKGFRDFILRGNVLDLAVAVILGMAFNAVVTSLEMCIRDSHRAEAWKTRS